MRVTLYRLLIAMPAAATLYCGQYWANRTGGGCALADEDRLAALGMVIIVVAIVGFVSALLRRWMVGTVSAAAGIVLTIVGFTIALSCLQ